MKIEYYDCNQSSTAGYFRLLPIKLLLLWRLINIVIAKFLHLSMITIVSIRRK